LSLHPSIHPYFVQTHFGGIRKAFRTYVLRFCSTLSSFLLVYDSWYYHRSHGC